MRVIAYAEIVCDNCGKRIVRMAAPGAREGKRNANRLMKRVQALATEKSWQLEGPFAEDLCSPCRVVEHAA